jgi:hypothetical protein
MGRRQIAFVLAIAAGAGWPGRTQALVFEVTPTATLGITDNASSSATDVAANRTEAFDTLGLAARLSLTRALSMHHLQYAIYHTTYSQTAAADNTSQNLAWRSDLALSGRTNLMLGANVTLYRYSAIATLNPTVTQPTATPIDATGAAVGGTPTDVVNSTATEAFSYQPNGAQNYLQSFSASYSRPLDTNPAVPELVSLVADARGERIMGVNTLSLSLLVNDLVRVDKPPGPTATYGTGDVVTMQLLAGWRRDVSPRTSFELLAGPFAFYGTATQSLAVGPAAIGSATYRRLLWYATLTVGQQPTVNVYLGQAVLADSAVGRVTLPLNARETLVIAGVAGYTYARQIRGNEHFIFAPRLYDLVLVSGVIAYRFERLPIFAGLDYSVTSQRGSIIDGMPTPNMRRRIIGLSLGGRFGWGEGQHGLWRD